MTAGSDDSVEQCERAKQLYKDSLDPTLMGEAWREAVDESLAELRSLLEVSDSLRNITQALLESGRHVRGLRHLLSPPLSQDQFKLACPEWPKSSEKTGRPIVLEKALAVSASIEQWMGPEIAREVSSGQEIDLLGAAYLMAEQQYKTLRRNKLSQKQEQDACKVLEEVGFERVAASVIDEPGGVEKLTYLQKTQFTTADGSSHEVDVAVGLNKRQILALECKVSNDATNSIKRVNDVMKKSEAWKRQWGKFVQTGALLQGVFKPRDISRMLDAEIVVFWSHDLNELKDWVARRI